MRAVGQLTDPYKDAEDEGLGITISGLPEEPEDPPTDDDIDVDLSELGVDEADAAGGAVDDESAAGDADDADDLDEDGDGDLEPGEEVAYDLSEWDDDQRAALGDALREAGVAHAWEEHELYVRDEDEQLVDDIIDHVTHPHALPEESDDGDAGGALMGELFVVSDRLQHDPEEHEAVAQLLRLANAAEEADPPYGLAQEDWDTLRERVEAVAEALEVDDPDGDEVIEAAVQLRDAIRPYV